MFAREESKALPSTENGEWSNVKGLFINTKTVLLASCATIGTALVQIYSSKSRSTKDITATFDRISEGLKNNTQITQQLASVASSLSNKVSVETAEKLMGDLITTLNSALAANEDLIADAANLKKYTLKTTTDYNTIRAITVGGPAAIIAGALLVDYLQQFKRALNPSDKPHLVIGASLFMSTFALLVVRTSKCFSPAYADAAGGYMCSKAEDETSRNFNNGLIGVAFLAGASGLMRLMNNCFIDGFSPTMSNIGSSLRNAPGAARVAAGNVYDQVKLSFFTKPGDRVVVSREGAEDLNIEVDRASSAASAPLLSSQR